MYAEKEETAKIKTVPIKDRKTLENRDRPMGNTAFGAMTAG